MQKSPHATRKHSLREHPRHTNVRTRSPMQQDEEHAGSVSGGIDNRLPATLHFRFLRFFFSEPKNRDHDQIA